MWVATVIMKVAKVKPRARMMAKFIKIAEVLLLLIIHSFATLSLLLLFLLLIKKKKKIAFERS